MLYSLAESQTTKGGTKNFKGAFMLKFHGSSVKHHKPVVYSERQYYWGTWTWDEKKNVMKKERWALAPCCSPCNNESYWSRRMPACTEEYIQKPNLKRYEFKWQVTDLELYIPDGEGSFTLVSIVYISHVYVKLY